MKRAICLLIAGTWVTPLLAQSVWVSARGVLGGRDHIHEFDTNGVYTTVSVDQVAGAQSSSWGYRDGAADRSAHIFYGWEDGVARHNADGSGGVQIISGGIPFVGGTWHGLAFDPTGDGGNGSLWAVNFTSDRLAEVSLSGALLNSYSNLALDMYGLAYDDTDGNLWVHLNGIFTGRFGGVIKINITTNPGTIMAGQGWFTGFWFINHGGGMSGFHDGSGWMAAINQAIPDELGFYDSVGNMVGGPWDLQAQTGITGHLGVAVVYDETCAVFLCGDANCDGLFNGGDIDAFFFALGDPTAWELQFPGCDRLCLVDINHDGRVDGGDIDPFFAALGVGQCP